IAPKAPNAVVAVAINGDTFNEPNETFRVALSSPVNATLGTPSVGNCTILNDDGTPQILIDDVKVTERNSGKTLAQVVLSLTNGSNQPSTVDYSSADGWATVADNDYQPQTGTVTWPAKDAASKTVVISVNGDLKNEPDESFFVNLANAVNA